MDEKQQSQATEVKSKKYRETLNLDSASGWEKCDLNLFRVVFDLQRYTVLQEEFPTR